MTKSDNDEKEIWRRAAPHVPVTSCPDLNMLAAYADGRLNAGEADAVERHLSTCPSCMDSVASVREQADASRSAPLRLRPAHLLKWGITAAACAAYWALAYQMGFGMARNNVAGEAMAQQALYVAVSPEGDTR